jgi:hypothetical protein
VAKPLLPVSSLRFSLTTLSSMPANTKVKSLSKLHHQLEAPNQQKALNLQMARKMQRVLLRMEKHLPKMLRTPRVHQRMPRKHQPRMLPKMPPRMLRSQLPRKSPRKPKAHPNQLPLLLPRLLLHPSQPLVKLLLHPHQSQLPVRPHHPHHQNPQVKQLLPHPHPKRNDI